MILTPTFHSALHSQVAQPPSQARLAAEAFFFAKSEPLDSSRGEVIIHRKPRAPGIGELAPPEAADAAKVQDNSRSPTVHRMPSGVTVAEVQGAFDANVVGLPPTGMAEKALHSTPPVVRRLPRKKHRQLHGEVTITRPADAGMDPAPTGDPDMTEIARCKLAAPRPVVAHSPVALNEPAWTGYAPRYPALLARIKSLEAEAERARRHEAVEVVRWIRGAIRDYALTPNDLGLG